MLREKSTNGCYLAWFDGLPYDYGEMVWRKIGSDLVWMFLPETWTIEQDDDLFWTCYDPRRSEAEDWGAFCIGLTYMDLFEPSEEEMLAAERDGVVSQSIDQAYTSDMFADDGSEDDDDEDEERGADSIEEEDSMIRYAYRRLEGTPIGLRIANFTFGLRKDLVDDPEFQELYHLMRAGSEAAEIALHPSRPIVELEE